MRRREFITLFGVAAAWPLAARAQQPAMPVIGYLSVARERAIEHLTAAFRKGLAEQGYVEGRNVEILYRWAETQFDRLPALAADLVRRRVDVIVTTAGAASALAAKSATASIPIVFQMGEDPIDAGLVTSLNRPGGNITGATFLSGALTPKRLELLHEMVPAVTMIGYLVNPTNPQTKAQISQTEAGARALGVRLPILDASTPSEIEATFKIFVEERIGALLVDNDALFFNERDRLAALAARHAIPAIYHSRENVKAGGLMSYGAAFADAFRLAGTYAGRILKGETPSDLPIQQSARIELILNMKTAKALGLTFPLTLLGRADDVIE
jgi:putative tryptophan/tyrosine transport system substrate-binding protein